MKEHFSYEGIIGKRLGKAEPYLYTIFRVMIGFFYAMHGASKLGLFTSKAAQTVGSLMWFVGIVEITVGTLILFGLWTRLAAITGSIIMISAYIKAHLPNGLNPMANGGELALMFLVAFLVILVHGSGKYGVEQCISKKECI